MAAARGIDANNGCACCSFGDSAECNATNPLGRGFVAPEARVARGERAKHSFQSFSDCHTAVLPQTNCLQKEPKNYKIDSTDDKKEAGNNPNEKSLVEKGRRLKARFRLTESSCIIIGLSRSFYPLVDVVPVALERYGFR